MKKKSILFTAVAGMIYLGTTSYHGGAAADGSLNRTGADGTTANCAGSSCHTGTAPAPTAKIHVDSAGGVPVTKYTPGKTYTIRVVGKHAVNDEFGFQFAAVSGTGSGQVQAGTYGTSLPANVAKHTLTGLDLIEHTDHIAAISPADSFVRSFSWTAPLTDLGNVSLYLTVNAVNGNHMADMGDVSANISMVLAPYAATSSVADVTTYVGVTAYPNPANDAINVSLSGVFGDATIIVYDMLGRSVAKCAAEAWQVSGSIRIDMSELTPGMYHVVLTTGSKQYHAQVLKQ